MYYRKPIMAALPFLLAMVLSCMQLHAQDRGWGSKSIGGVFSPRAVGFDAFFQRPGKHFTTLALNVDLSDITEGKSLQPGIRVSYHYDTVLREKDCNGFPMRIYLGPGIVAGYVHDRGSVNFGFMAGLSCNAGICFGMWHHIVLAVEWQADIAFLLEGESTVSVYKSGLVYSYWPFLKINYEF